MSAVFSALLCLPSLLASYGEPRGYPRGKMLVELRDALPATVQVLDARKPDEYQKGHFPGAANVDVEAWRKAFAAGQDPKAWAERLGAVGVDGKSTVVVYDDNNFLDAARVWFILRFWGVEDVRLLNGGWKGWVAAGGKPQKSAPPRPVSMKLDAHPERLATKQQVLDILKDRNDQILDARSYGEFCGTVAKAERGGAIPGAVHLEWSDVLDKKTQRFKSAEELTKLFRDAGVDPNKPAVTYCQSGGRASVLVFALELMGGKQVRNYYRSWQEWGNDADTPIMRKKE